MRITSIEGASGRVEIESKGDLGHELNYWVGSQLGVIWLEYEEKTCIVARYGDYSVYTSDPETDLFTREKMNGERLIRHIAAFVEAAFIQNSEIPEIFWTETGSEYWISGFGE